MRCIAEFTLDSDLCLPDGSEPMVMKGPNEEFSLTLSNSKEGLARPDGVITAQLIFEAESLEDAREVAQRRLASIMNALTFTTNRKFGQSRLRRVIDWTPGLASRDALIIVEAPVWEIAEPELDQKFIDTASRMFAIQAGEQQQNALRWYRLGIQSEILEEQFTYFWFALEIASEILNDHSKVPTACPQCQSALYCKNCEKNPVHRKYASDAIRQVITEVTPKGADSSEVFTALQAIRHTLMHGRRIDSVIKKLPCTEVQAVNTLARITWRAMMETFDPDKDPAVENAFDFGFVDSVARSKIVAAAHVSFGMKGGDPDNPMIGDVPEFQASIRHDGLESLR